MSPADVSEPPKLSTPKGRAVAWLALFFFVLWTADSVFAAVVEADRTAQYASVSQVS